MKKLQVFWIACWLPWLAFGQQHEERYSRIDAQKYRYAIALDANSSRIQVSADVHIYFLASVSSFDLDLVAPQGETGMRVDLVEEMSGETTDGLRYDHRGDQLKIYLNRISHAGESRTFRIEYEGTPADGLVIGQNRHGHKTYFGDNWPNRARHWLVSVDHPSDKASVEWLVNAPAGVAVVANGTLISHEGFANGTELWHYFERTPIPTKVMVIGVADFATQELEPVGPTPLFSWTFPEDSSLGFRHYAPARDILEAFVDSLAPFPFEKLANVQSKTRYGGMENAGCIFYAENSVDRDIVPLLAHEIAHQWFGNHATEANWHHVWLSEGFATYLTNLYLEWSEGKGRLHERLEMERQKVLRYAAHTLRPVVDTAVTNYNELLNPNSYEKGAWVLHMLRQQVGDRAFMEGLRTYIQRFGGGNALTEDLQETFEDVSGQELGWFFDQWIFRAGHPEIEVNWKSKPRKGILELEVKQVQEGPAFRCRLELALTLADGSEIREFLHLTDKSQVIRMTLPGEIQGLVPDPDKKLLGTFEVTGN